MPTFMVSWSITIDAEDVEDAVKQAWGTMQDPESTATYFWLEWTDDKGIEHVDNGDFYDTLYPAPDEEEA